MFLFFIFLLFTSSVRAITLLDLPSTTCHLAKNSRLGHYLSCDGPLKASRDLKKSPIHLKEESGAFGVFPEELNPGQSFGIFLKAKEDLFKHVSYTATLTASDGQRNESIHIKVLFDDRPLEMLELDSLEYVIHVSNPITDGILKTFKVVNPESTQPTMFQYNLEGTFSEFFSIEPADPDLLLLRAKGCASLCPSLPDRFPLILTISDGNRLPTNVLLNIAMLWDTTTIFDTLHVHVEEMAGGFDQLVRAEFDDYENLHYNLTTNSDVFDIDRKFGILRVKNRTRLTIDYLGRVTNVTVSILKDGRPRGEQNILITLIPQNPARLIEDEYKFKVDSGVDYISKMIPKYDDFKLNFSVVGDDNFNINSTTRELKYTGRIYKNEKVYQIMVATSYERFIHATPVSIIINGFGSDPPRFQQDISTLILDIEKANESVIYSFKATDEDTDSNLFYNITSIDCYVNDGCAGYFHLSEDGHLQIKNTGDLHLNIVKLEVEVRDLQHPTEPGDKSVLLISFTKKVTPQRDTRDDNQFSYLNENVHYFDVIRGESYVGHINVSETEVVTFESDLLSLAIGKDGTIFLKENSTLPLHDLSVPVVITVRNASLTRYILIVIRIIGGSIQHDIPPVQARIYEDVDIGTYVANLNIRTTAENITLLYSLSSTMLDNVLVSDKNGVIQTSASLYGLSGVYEVIALIKYENGTDQIPFTLEVLSVSHCNPSFSDKNPITLYEGERTIVLVHSNDKCNLTFSVDGNSTHIDERTGELTVKEVLRDEIVTVTASDKNHQIQYEIEVRKSKDAQRQLECEDKITLKIKENVKANTIIGKMNVAGRTRETKFKLFKPSDLFDIDEKGWLSIINSYNVEKSFHNLTLDVYDAINQSNRAQCEVFVEFIPESKRVLSFSKRSYEVVLNECKPGLDILHLTVKDSLQNGNVFYEIKKVYFENKPILNDIFEINPLSGRIRLIKALSNITQGYFQLSVVAQRQKEITETSVIAWIVKADDISKIVIRIPPMEINSHKISTVLNELSEITNSKAILASLQYYLVNGVPLNNGTVLRVLFVSANKIISPELLKPIVETQYMIYSDEEYSNPTLERALLISSQPMGLLLIGFVSVLLTAFSILACIRCHYQHKYEVKLKRFRKLSEAANIRTDALKKPYESHNEQSKDATVTDINQRASFKRDKSEVQQVSMQL